MLEIECKELVQVITGRCGLIVGPSLTLDAGSWMECNSALASRFACEKGASVFETAEKVLDDCSIEEVREWFRQFVAEKKGPRLLSHLAQAKWSAILSLSIDTNLETLIEVENSKRPARRDLSIVTDFLQVLQPRTVPCFKLIGSVAHHDFVSTESEYLAAKSSWRHAISSFVDFVKSQPVLCVGLSEDQKLLHDLAGELLGSQQRVSRLILLSDDPVTQNRVATNLLTRSTRVVTARGTIGDVVRALNEADKRGPTLPLPFPDEKGPFSSLESFADVAVVVNACLQTEVKRSETHFLENLLFSPGLVRWDPFVYNMDFRRTVGRELYNQALMILRQQTIESRCVILSGSSASGKTVVLKRVAFDLASAGFPVLWFRAWYFADFQRILFDLFQTAKRNKINEPIVVCLDDPLSYGTVPPREIANAARQAGVTILLIVAARTADRRTVELIDLTGGLPIVCEESAGDQLDDVESRGLCSYLVQLGVAESLDSAQTQVESVLGKNTQDTLSTLYWLLPGTKTNIASSVREEYRRLGDRVGFRKLIVGTVEHTTDLLKRAYEYVAVASKYRARLPIEVLVHALGLDDYGEWISAAGADGAAWGLLYSDAFEDGGEFYTTRNDLVTQLITDTLNGGPSFGRHGELRVLGELIDACTGRSTPVYREFCVRLLVSQNEESDSCAIRALDYEEGLDLYERAEKALAFPDRTLVHHKGIWIRTKGKDPLLAAKVFEQALATPLYPYASRGEASQHIHNSIAAAAVDAIRAKKVDLDTGKSIVREHLAKARSANFFNPSALHVQGKHILQIAKEEGAPNSKTLQLISETLGDIDGTLLLLKNPAKNSRFENAAISYLENIRLAITEEAYSLEEVRAIGESLWKEKKDPIGLIAIARFLYRKAMGSGSGTDFRKADEFCHYIFRELENENADIPAMLYDVALHVYFQWRVQRRLLSSSQDSIDWQLIHDYAKNSSRNSGDAHTALNLFIEALAHAHLGRWAQALLIFQQIRNLAIPREILTEPRAYLMNTGGGIRRIEGEMRTGSRDRILFCEELNQDFIATHYAKWPRDGERSHANIEFSFSGPRCVLNVPNYTS